MSFPRYSSYRRVSEGWFSEIPSHWKSRAGARLFSPVREQPTLADEQLSATQKYGVVPQKLFMEWEGQKVALAIGGTENFRHVESGDFVISLRSFEGGIELSRYVGCVSPAYTVLRPRDPVETQYWAYLLKAPCYVDALSSMTDGLRDGKKISYAHFGAVNLPVPPIREQIAITSFLDRETAKIDALVAEQQRLMELLKEKRQAVISHAVTKGLNPEAPMKASGVEWLGEVPAHWEVVRIKHVSSMISKGTTPMTIGAEFTESGIRFLKAENITEDGVADLPEFFISESSHSTLYRSALQSGDVLVVIAGATTGKSAVLTAERVPANTNQAVSFIRLANNRVSAYLHLYLSTQLIRNFILLNSVQSAQPNLSMEDLGNIPMTLPPQEEMERLTATLGVLLEDLTKLNADAQKTVALLQERRTALISAAVTGKIDIRGNVDAEAP